MAENDKTINNPLPFKYGAYHEWKCGIGCLIRIDADGHSNPEIAFDSVAAGLRRVGFYLPRIWEFWRWNERCPDWLKARFQ